MIIREADAARDAARIAEIYKPYVEDTDISFETVAPDEEEIRRRILNLQPDYPYFVAEDESGHLLGYCYAHPWKARVSYNPTLETSIYLRPEAKGLGIGTALMHKLTEAARGKGFVSLIACITADNEESCAFHRKLGFEQVSLFKKVGRKFGRLLDVADFQYML